MSDALRRPAWIRLLSHTVLILLAIPCLLPLVWMISTSLKTDAQIFPAPSEGFSAIGLKDIVPNPVQWRNYPDALRFVPFGTYLQNTLMLCLVTTVGAVLSSAVVAYGFARTRFRGRKILFIAMLSTLMLPPQVTMIPTFILYKYLGWYGTCLPLTVPSFMGAPFFVFLMVQFFRTIPRELTEAARIDGCGDIRIFATMIIPLAVPVLATCALFQFIGTWNDFLGPLIYLNSPDKYTLAYGLQQFLGSHGSKWAYLMAGATVFTVPIIALFFLAQKTFIQGIATTGGK
ncbi:MAG: carbohydrate ABC transporter permease [Candidatus Sumerlaeota bacterium]|nr:carbohydrate ABC transporter permease [Candidatus Sumerlaeota bacterium]